MKEQLVGFKVFRKSKSIKKKGTTSILNYVSDKRHAKKAYLALFGENGCRLWNLFLLHYKKNKQKTIHRSHQQSLLYYNQKI
jgi:hypothetical protein